MTTEQVDRDETTEDFIDTIEEAKQYQHPTVDGAVCGYIQEMDMPEGVLYVKIIVPAYDDEIRERIADVDGTVNEDSILYPKFLSKFDDISKLPTQNPIPVKKRRDEYYVVQTQDGLEDEDIEDEIIRHPEYFTILVILICQVPLSLMVLYSDIRLFDKSEIWMFISVFGMTIFILCLSIYLQPDYNDIDYYNQGGQNE